MEISAAVVVGWLKWLLIFLSVTFNATLALKILRRRKLHSVFNLAMCFYFAWQVVLSPMMFYQYGEVIGSILSDRTNATSQDCHRLALTQLLNMQPIKAILLSIIFR